MNNLNNDVKVIPVIISGGIGLRLWPLSRDTLPKPYLKLYDTKSLLQNTILRCQNPDIFKEPIVVANIRNKFIAQSQLNEINANNVTLLFETKNCNTAASVAVATEYARIVHGDDALLLIMPVDHLIEDQEAFVRSVQLGITPATKDALVLFGTKPTTPNQEFGYIHVAPSHIDSLFCIENFSEKPDKETAEKYYSDGEHYWNSGIYLASVKRFIRDFNTYHPNLFHVCEEAVLTSSPQSDSSVILSADAYNNCPNISFDYAITEHAADMAMVELHSKWYDLGNWNVLYEIDHKDKNQNVIHGDVISLESERCYVRSENNKLILLLGIKDCLLIETRDAILLADKNHLSSLRELLGTMQENQRKELSVSSTVFKPWGSYTVFESGVNFQIKKLSIKAHQSISLQEHQYRSEHWVVLKGKATVTLGQKVSVVNPNESIFVPQGMRHRIENNSESVLEIIEVQIGSYLGEDDIKRYEDEYNRISSE